MQKQGLSLFYFKSNYNPPISVIADEIGVSYHNTLQKFVKGNRTLSMPYLKKVENFLDLEMGMTKRIEKNKKAITEQLTLFG
ncbi:helix-turn-helix transcriptional regulator [Staphylococcus hyicus]|uniref:helix-turn-helix transcriptional regulator n=1 Tax=Staphylococcus hyicus TaxID=1284 RepID=UPI000E67BE1D|nr:helix-turn-helix transcriptional regulator [Staphylococcus hyicus]MCE5154956.1 helix-turn-helix transcriptional regulator [Staphylococcus hyicus]